MESEQIDSSFSENIGAGGGGNKASTSFSSYTEFFEKQCPTYMLYGMTYEQYWNGEPQLVKVYKELHKLKIDEANQMAWLQGQYIYDSIGKLAPILHPFAKKGTKPGKYPSQPYDLWGERKEEEQKQLDPGYLYMQQMMSKLNSSKK